ncbi:hypothetical protein V1282_003447 [Nitrobacteraceae bacterium AZCC 2146]
MDRDAPAGIGEFAAWLARATTLTEATRATWGIMPHCNISNSTGKPLTK